jgi:anti-sigma factor RsiW
MSNTLCSKLGAYVDGELDQRGQSEVQAHLETCQACQQELKELQGLSMLLHAAPLPDFTPAASFKAQHMAELPQRAGAEQDSARQSSSLLPWIAPALVLAGWVFMQVTLNLSTLVLLAGEVEILKGAAWTLGSPQQMQ